MKVKIYTYQNYTGAFLLLGTRDVLKRRVNSQRQMLWSRKPSDGALLQVVSANLLALSYTQIFSQYLHKSVVPYHITIAFTPIKKVIFYSFHLKQIHLKQMPFIYFKKLKRRKKVRRNNNINQSIVFRHQILRLDIKAAIPD